MTIKSASLKVGNWSQAHCVKTDWAELPEMRPKEGNGTPKEAEWQGFEPAMC